MGARRRANGLRQVRRQGQFGGGHVAAVAAHVQQAEWGGGLIDIAQLFAEPGFVRAGRLRQSLGDEIAVWQRRR